MRNRTVKESLINRLLLMAEESEEQNLIKIAEHLTNQVNNLEARADDAFYIFSNSDFTKEVEDNLWNAAIAASDFYDTPLEAQELQILIEKYAQDLIQDLRTRIFKVNSPVGAFEPKLPGEMNMTTAFEVVDDAI